MGCVFRIVEYTNYHLSSILTDTGYALWKCGIVGELFLPDGNLPEDADLEDILQFSKVYDIKKILADIPETEELPEKYKQAGFSRIYLYRCYQKEEKSSPKQEEKSSKKWED